MAARWPEALPALMADKVGQLENPKVVQLYQLIARIVDDWDDEELPARDGRRRPRASGGSVGHRAAGLARRGRPHSSASWTCSQTPPTRPSRGSESSSTSAAGPAGPRSRSVSPDAVACVGDDEVSPGKEVCGGELARSSTDSVATSSTERPQTSRSWMPSRGSPRDRGLPMAQVALAWVLSKQVVAGPIVGATKPRHLDDAMAALDVGLSAEEVGSSSAASTRLVRQLWTALELSGGRSGRRRGRILASSHMIEARRTSLRASRYDIVVDGAGVATWSGSAWRPGGTMELGRRHEVRGNVWGSMVAMVVEWHADRVGGSRRPQELDRRGRRGHLPVPVGVTVASEERAHRQAWVGSVRRASVWRGDAVADLPGLPLAAVFVLGGSHVVGLGRSGRGLKPSWRADGGRGRRCGHPPFTRDGRVPIVESLTPPGDPLLRGALAPPQRTLIDILRGTAARHPDSPAIDNGREVLTYDELLEAADGVATALREQGIGRSDRVGVGSPGTTDLYVAILGILVAGAVRAGRPRRPGRARPTGLRGGRRGCRRHRRPGDPRGTQ